MKVAAIPALVTTLVLIGCQSASLGPDAAIACGWNEPDSPVVSALDANAAQLADNVEQANIRLEAARRVADADPRFDPLVEALQETSDFATELTTLSAGEIRRIPTSRWDFAKYVQAAARDQCEQLADVVGNE